MPKGCVGFPFRCRFGVLLECRGEDVRSVCCRVALSGSSKDRSMTRCLDLFLCLVRVEFSGKATDPILWLPFAFLLCILWLLLRVCCGVIFGGFGYCEGGYCGSASYF